MTRHAVAFNSFASVRGVKHSVIEGKTAEISIAQAKTLCDHAVLGVLTYTGARIGAVANLHLTRSTMSNRQNLVTISFRVRY